MSITAQEISRRVGCSTATVSRALNNTGVVSPSTREAIYRTLKETNHLPERSGKRKRRQTNGDQTSKLIHIVYHRHSPMETVSIGHGGLTVGPMGPVSEAFLLRRSTQSYDSFYRQIIDGAVSELPRWGYKAVLQINTDLEAPDFLADINASGKNGVLLVGEYSQGLKTMVELCRHPLVLADNMCDNSHDVVTTDNLAGIGMAFDHVYGLGHRRIGFVGRFDSNFAYAERFNAFKMKMAEVGLPVRSNWIYEGYSHVEPAVEGMKKMLSSPDRPSALICSNDWVALGTIRAASGLGISLPGDLSIVGFDDGEAASVVTPALTSVHVPVTEIGRQSVLLLAMRAKSGMQGQQRSCRIRLLPDLVVRGSTAPYSESLTSGHGAATDLDSILVNSVLACRPPTDSVIGPKSDIIPPQ